MTKRGGWWLTGRTVPAAIAGACQPMCLVGFFIAINLLSEKNDSRIFLGVFVVFLVLAPIVGGASVRALRRHPSWVREPADPLDADDAGLWWKYGVGSLVLLLLGAVAQLWLRNPTMLAILFFPFLLGMWSFRVLSRRAPSAAATTAVVAGGHSDG